MSTLSQAASYRITEWVGLEGTLERSSSSKPQTQAAQQPKQPKLPILFFPIPFPQERARLDLRQTNFSDFPLSYS